MTRQEIDDMDQLAAVLRSAAGRLQRAAQVLRLAGDMERIEARCRDLARPVPSVAPAAGRATPAETTGAAIVSGDRDRLSAVATPTPKSRIAAVFDGGGRETAKQGNNKTGEKDTHVGRQTTAYKARGSVARGVVDESIVPF